MCVSIAFVHRKASNIDIQGLILASHNGELSDVLCEHFKSCLVAVNAGEFLTEEEKKTDLINVRVVSMGHTGRAGPFSNSRFEQKNYEFQRAQRAEFFFQIRDLNEKIMNFSERSEPKFFFKSEILM